MKTLTTDQINAVIEWMNTWEQLKNSAIPLRFIEDFTNQLNPADILGSTRPPLGIMPYLIWKEHRKSELMEAIRRYLNAELKVPPEWITELNEHCK